MVLVRMSQVPDKLGPYTVEQEIGRGGMGVVYLARDPRLDRKVAIKVLPEDLAENPDRLTRFEREARVLASLNHPNLAAVFGLHEHLGQQLLVMEYVPGEHLGERLKNGRALSVEEALSIGVQIAAALEAAHDNGIIHRDMKPANVRVRPDGVVKVLDFGLAKPERDLHGAAASDEATMSMATEVGRVLGTAGYMSPEQARGRAVDKRADIWAFGAVLFECLTSVRAFPGETPIDAMVAILEKQPAWNKLPEQTPGRVTALLHRMLEKDASRRLRDIGDARIELDEALESMGRRSSPRGVGRHALPGGSAGAAGAVGAGAPSAPTATPAPGPAAVAAGRGESPAAPGSWAWGGPGSRGPVGPGGPSSGSLGSRAALPVVGARFVGRAAEIEAIAERIKDARLLTLVGPGGCGKSRLAVESLRAAWPREGAVLVDLSAISDAGLVGVEVVQSLGIAAGGGVEGRDPASAVAEALGGRAVVLLLDNCEHVAEGVRSFAASLMALSPAAVVVCTSREPLGLPGESVIRIGALRVPNEEDGRDAGTLARCESVELFVDRARATRPTFALDDRTAPAVAQICRQLDGVPLALELAAARVKLLSPEQIAERLNDRFKLLRGGRGGHSRQQTLEAAIDWSYDQLAPRERAVFRRLCVARGGVTLDAAEAIISGPYPSADGTGEAINDWDVLDLVEQLVDKSMLLVEAPAHRPGPAGEARYTMLESIRHYGLGKLEQAGEQAEARQRHLMTVVRLAERAESEMLGPQQRGWLERLEQEHDNIRAALDLVESGKGDLDLGRRIAGSVWRFWAYRGHIAEGRRRLAALDALSRGSGPTAAWAKLREGMSWIAMLVGDLMTAISFGRAGLEIARATGDERTTSNLLNCLGAACHGEGLPERALDYFQESLALRRHLGDALLVAQTVHNIAECYRSMGLLDKAKPLYLDALKLLEDGDAILAALAHSNLALLELGRGRLREAWASLRRGAEVKLALGATTELPAVLETAASIAVAENKMHRAARLFAAAEAARETLASPPRPSTRADYEPWLEKLRAALEGTDFAAAWAEGRGMRLRRAVRYALDEAEAAISSCD